jgi:3-hydroxyacyl-[acyl-carrier-protein] dehydratase
MNSDKSLTLFRKVVDRPVFDRKRGTVSAEFRCPADFPPFAGHFPGQPVLPAVVQLVFVRILAADLLQTDLELVRTGRIKFKEMVRPDEIVNIHIALEEIDQQWHALFKLKKNDSVVASGTILYRARR